MTVMGNGGKLTTNLKADLEGYGEVWFDERAITNILSLKNVSKKKGFHMSYDSVGDQGFTIHKPNGNSIHFPMHILTDCTTLTSRNRKSPFSRW
jgi:hypothetical protein